MTTRVAQTYVGAVVQTNRPTVRVSQVWTYAVVSTAVPPVPSYNITASSEGTLGQVTGSGSIIQQVQTFSAPQGPINVRAHLTGPELIWYPAVANSAAPVNPWTIVSNPYKLG